MTERVPAFINILINTSATVSDTYLHSLPTVRVDDHPYHEHRRGIRGGLASEG